MTDNNRIVLVQRHNERRGNSYEFVIVEYEERTLLENVYLQKGIEKRVTNVVGLTLYRNVQCLSRGFFIFFLFCKYTMFFLEERGKKRSTFPCRTITHILRNSTPLSLIFIDRFPVR